MIITEEYKSLNITQGILWEAHVLYELYSSLETKVFFYLPDIFKGFGSCTKIISSNCNLKVIEIRCCSSLVFFLRFVSTLILMIH